MVVNTEYNHIKCYGDILINVIFNIDLLQSLGGGTARVWKQDHEADKVNEISQIH
jgi:hypothetical protein